MPTRSGSVGTTQEDLVNVQKNRVSLHVFNTHTSNKLYVKEGSEVSTSNGIPIYAGGNWGIVYREDGDLVTERWVIIADGASTTYIVSEGLVK